MASAVGRVVRRVIRVAVLTVAARMAIAVGVVARVRRVLRAVRGAAVAPITIPRVRGMMPPVAWIRRVRVMLIPVPTPVIVPSILPTRIPAPHPVPPISQSIHTTPTAHRLIATRPITCPIVRTVAPSHPMLPHRPIRTTINCTTCAAAVVVAVHLRWAWARVVRRRVTVGVALLRVRLPVVYSSVRVALLLSVVRRMQRCRRRGAVGWGMHAVRRRHGRVHAAPRVGTVDRPSHTLNTPMSTTVRLTPMRRRRVIHTVGRKAPSGVLRIRMHRLRVPRTALRVRARARAAPIVRPRCLLLSVRPRRLRVLLRTMAWVVVGGVMRVRLSARVGGSLPLPVDVTVTTAVAFTVMAAVVVRALPPMA